MSDRQGWGGRGVDNNQVLQKLCYAHIYARTYVLKYLIYSGANTKRKPTTTEMEFLDIILTKDLSFLLHSIHSPFYWRISKNPILFFGFNNPYKKICETRKLKSIPEQHFEERKMRVENQTKLESEKIQVYAQKLRLKIPFKNTISGHLYCIQDLTGTMVQ